MYLSQAGTLPLLHCSSFPVLLTVLVEGAKSKPKNNFYVDLSFVTKIFAYGCCPCSSKTSIPTHTPTCTCNAPPSPAPCEDGVSFPVTIENIPPRCHWWSSFASGIRRGFDMHDGGDYAVEFGGRENKGMHAN